MSPAKKFQKTAEGEEPEKIFPTPTPEPVFEPCDKKSTLYSANETKVRKIKTEIHLNYSRAFHIKIIPKSNLFLVVVKSNDNQMLIKPPSKPEKIIYDDHSDHPCYKLNMSFLLRRRIEECYVNHEDVSILRVIY